MKVNAGDKDVTIHRYGQGEANCVQTHVSEVLYPASFLRNGRARRPEHRPLHDRGDWHFVLSAGGLQLFDMLRRA
jgi:hypothetical protein